MRWSLFAIVTILALSELAYGHFRRPFVVRRAPIVVRERIVAPAPVIVRERIIAPRPIIVAPPAIIIR